MKAKQIINIIEGFKLGSLGVGKHFVDISPPDSEQQADYPSSTNIKIDNFKKLDGGFRWEETLEDRKQFSDWVEPEFHIYNGGKVFVDFYIMKYKKLYLPAIDLKYQPKSGRGTHGRDMRLDRVITKDPGFKISSAGYSWLFSLESKIKHKGLISLGFPDKWKSV
jgi:hypothetical protein